MEGYSDDTTYPMLSIAIGTPPFGAPVSGPPASESRRLAYLSGTLRYHTRIIEFVPFAHSDR